MKATKLLLIILLVSASGRRIFSQHLVTGFSAGMGSYSMQDLKDLNEAVKPFFDSKLVSNFPPYLYYQYSLVLDKELFSCGMFYSFQSTGSRISAKDYSGEYCFNSRVHSNNLGVYLSLHMLSKNKFRLSIYANPGLAFSKLDLSENLTIFDEALVDTSLNFKAVSVFLEPGIAFSIFVIPSVSISINAGYSLPMGEQSFHLDGEKENLLTIPKSGQEIKPNWTGFRFGISAMYNLKLKKRDTNKTE